MFAPLRVPVPVLPMLRVAPPAIVPPPVLLFEFTVRLPEPVLRVPPLMVPEEVLVLVSVTPLVVLVGVEVVGVEGVWLIGGLGGTGGATGAWGAAWRNVVASIAAVHRKNAHVDFIFLKGLYVDNENFMAGVNIFLLQIEAARLTSNRPCVASPSLPISPAFQHGLSIVRDPA